MLVDKGELYKRRASACRRVRRRVVHGRKGHDLRLLGRSGAGACDKMVRYVRFALY